mgnify:CR=1 FL=1
MALATATTSQSNILFLDIETVPQFSGWDALEPEARQHWSAKVRALRTEDSPEEHYARAGIYAEFGKVIVVSVGMLHQQEGEEQLRIKSLSGDDEAVLLHDFAQLCNSTFQAGPDEGRPRFRFLCAHNGKEFDFPYLARRMVIQGLPLPALLDQQGKKPWETPFIDTMHQWRFGDYKHFTSLSLLAYCLGLPSPKEDIDGSQVYPVYYHEEGGLERIARYAQRDVYTLVQVYRRLNGMPLLNEHQIEYR